MAANGITVSVGADTTDLRRGLGLAERQVRNSTNKMEDSFKQLSSAVVPYIAGIGAALAGMGAATFAAAQEAGQAAKELNYLGQAAGITGQELESLAAATQTVGIDADAMSGIIKDLNDRIGDFTLTGAGPMVDVMAAIGGQTDLTIQQLQAMSGPDGLIALKTAFDQANLSAKEQTFLFESISSEATRLMPLLADNGAELLILQQRFNDLGFSLTKGEARALTELDYEMQLAASGVKTLAAALVENLLPGIREVTSELTEGLSEFIAYLRADELERKVIDYERKIANLQSNLQKLRSGEGTFMPGVRDKRIQAAEQQLAAYTELLNKARASIEETSGGEPLITVTTGQVGGIESLETNIQSRLDIIRNGLATENELIWTAYEERKAAIDEALANELIAQDEHNQLALELRQQAIDSQAALDDKERKARTQAYSGMFGDLASLMNTESRALFEVGKTAAIAQSIINGHSAAVDAYEKGEHIGGPPLGYAFMAAAIAATSVHIQALRAQQFGRNDSGGNATAAAATETTTLQQSVTIAIPEASSGGYSRDQVVDLIGEINNAVGDGVELRAS